MRSSQDIFALLNIAESVCILDENAVLYALRDLRHAKRTDSFDMVDAFVQCNGGVTNIRFLHYFLEVRTSSTLF